MCRKSSPRREGRDYRDTPNVLPLVAYGAVCGCIIRCSAHFASLFVHIKSSVKYVHSVMLCLYVIMSITIKNTTQHILSVTLCLYVIMSITIKNTTQHVLSVMLCLYVIMSITIKNTTQHILSVMLCLYVILSLIMFASRGGGVFH